MLARPPRHPALIGIIEVLWAGTSSAKDWSTERVFPSGSAHLSFRSCGTPIRLGTHGQHVEKRGVLGGPRSSAHLHDAPGARSIGAVLCAGALPRLFQVSAHSVANQHVGLDLLWGHHAERLADQLHHTSDAEALTRLEAFLVTRIRGYEPPAELALALHVLRENARVSQAARHTGRSSRTLRTWFHDAVGLSPKEWSQVQRAQRALRLSATEPDWSTVAYRAGFADQAHLSREVRRIMGVTPRQTRGHVPGQPNHMPVWSDDRSLPIPSRRSERQDLG